MTLFPPPKPTPRPKKRATEVDKVVNTIGGSAVVAKFLKRPQPTVCSWMARNRVPFKYWKALVDLAHRRKVRGVTIDMLWELHT